MNIKYRNFRRLGAGYKTTSVPDDLVKKRSSLSVVEFGQFLIGGAITINAVAALFFQDGNNPIVYGALLALGIFFIVSAFLLAADLPLYRITAVSCFLVSIVVSVFLIKKLVVLVALSLVLIVVVYLLYLHPPNKEYHSWVKSLLE